LHRLHFAGQHEDDDKRGDKRKHPEDKEAAEAVTFVPGYLRHDVGKYQRKYQPDKDPDESKDPPKHRFQIKAVY
jgi:hypothetical protein